MHPWLTSLEEIRVEDLLVPMAQDFVKFVSTYGEGAAIIDGVRRLKAGEEVVLLRVITGRPQRPPYAIMREEPLGILFSADEHFPYIMSAREDFPDTPHQNTPPPGTPFSLCIDDRDWAEARITYTPAELLQRIVSWFEKAGKDELHAVTQPLDPYFFGGTYTLILPGPVFELEPNDRCDLITIRADEKAKLLQLDYSREIDPSKIKEGTSRCVFVTYEVRPELMARMRAAPGTLALLDTELKTRGISLLEDLADKITAWSAEEDEWKRFRLESRLGILLKMPILHPKNGLTGADSIIAFVTNCPLGDVGVSLGRLSKSCVGCDEFPYVLTVPSDPIDYAKLEQTRLMPWNVVTSFDPDLAARMAGRKDQDSRAIVMV